MELFLLSLIAISIILFFNIRVQLHKAIKREHKAVLRYNDLREDLKKSRQLVSDLLNKKEK